jgi:hypothetical protein
VGSREGRLDRLGATRARFEDMVKRHDLGGWIEVHEGEAADAAAAVQGPVDLLLVDGLHDYAAVAADFHAFSDRLGPGARVAFHDYADYFPGVCAFVDALVAAGRWRVETAAGTLRVLAPVAAERLTVQPSGASAAEGAQAAA